MEKNVKRKVFLAVSASFNEKFPLGIVLFKIQLMPFRFNRMKTKKEKFMN